MKIAVIAVAAAVITQFVHIYIGSRIQFDLFVHLQTLVDL